MGPGENPSSQSVKDFAESVAPLLSRRELLTELEQGPSNDQFVLISLWHSVFKTYSEGMPHIVFMGGSLDRSYLAIFKRPLVPADLQRLWSCGSTAPTGSVL